MESPHWSHVNITQYLCSVETCSPRLCDVIWASVDTPAVHVAMTPRWLIAPVSTFLCMSVRQDFDSCTCTNQVKQAHHGSSMSSLVALASCFERHVGASLSKSQHFWRHAVCQCLSMFVSLKCLNGTIKAFNLISSDHRRLPEAACLCGVLSSHCHEAHRRWWCLGRLVNGSESR